MDIGEVEGWQGPRERCRRKALGQAVVVPHIHFHIHGRVGRIRTLAAREAWPARILGAGGGAEGPNVFVVPLFGHFGQTVDAAVDIVCTLCLSRCKRTDRFGLGHVTGGRHVGSCERGRPRRAVVPLSTFASQQFLLSRVWGGKRGGKEGGGGGGREKEE
jgi:hypothetical protein